MYETCARAEELLQVNIEDLDLPGRCCPVKSKGAKPRTRRGATHAEHVLQTVYWDAGTARLLPRLIKDRTHGPLFVGHRKPGPGKAVNERDVCPDTGLARLSYEQARALLDEATAIDRPEPDGTCTSCATPGLPTSGKPALVFWNSWPNLAIANPKTSVATSNPHPKPCATSLASSAQTATAADHTARHVPSDTILTDTRLPLVTRFLPARPPGVHAD